MGNENNANEVMYKMADYLLKKMKERGLVNEEECKQIRALNVETFAPEFAAIYL